jgi:DNA-binding response OmpR family regulator
MEKVLLIEDNRMIKILHERVLTKAGFQVITAMDGEEALRHARRASPDVILLDMLLPKISGPEVLRCLKHDKATAHIPVIVVTGLSQRNEDRLLRDGAAAFLEKADFLDNAQPLLHTVRVVLNQARHRKKPAHEIELVWNPNEVSAAQPTAIEVFITDRAAATE